MSRIIQQQEEASAQVVINILKEIEKIK